MVYSTIAIKLARLTGTSIAKSMKLVDDIGVKQARRVVDDLAVTTGKVVDDAGNVVTTGSKSGGGIVKNYWKPATLATAGTAGGIYAFREQELREMETIGSAEQAAGGAISDIANSDLSPEAKQKLIEMYLNRNSLANDDGGGGGGKDGGGLFGDSTTQLVVTLLVVAMVMNYALKGSGR